MQQVQTETQCGKGAIFNDILEQVKNVGIALNTQLERTVLAFTWYVMYPF